MISALTSEGRRRGGKAAAFVWLFGLYVLPLIHNVDHEHDHSHGRASPHEHPHPEPTHKHSRSHPHPHPDENGGEGHDRVPIDSDHGASSILHFASAAVDAHALPTLEPAGLVKVLAERARRSAPSRPQTFVLVRGPPTRN